MNNAFHFIVKALLVPQIFKFLSGLFWSEFMISQTEEQAITKNILPDILKVKDSKAMKFCS